MQKHNKHNKYYDPYIIDKYVANNDKKDHFDEIKTCIEKCFDTIQNDFVNFFDDVFVIRYVDIKGDLIQKSIPMSDGGRTQVRNTVKERILEVNKKIETLIFSEEEQKIINAIVTLKTSNVLDDLEELFKNTMYVNPHYGICESFPR